MAGKRDFFERERGKATALEGDVGDALAAFAKALDPERPRPMVPKPRQNGTITHPEFANTTAGNYLQAIRLTVERGLDLLGTDAETVNDFMFDLVTEPARRETDLVDYQGSLSKPSAKSYQSAVRAFYRFCTEPGQSQERPDVNVEWPADDIIMFSERSSPKHDEADMPGQAELDALREACLGGLNTRRDRAFVELAAGTGQRVYALITLKVKHVHPDPEDDVPHILLNPDIDGDGDKGAIEATGRWKPIVTDARPVRQWLDNHPLRDPAIREEQGAPDTFEECYCFIGDVRTSNTDASSHWHETAPREMLIRLKERTESMADVKTVDIPVNPHNWRHYAYTRSQDLPIDESTRRKVFGWSPGSDTGQTVYGHKANEAAGREFAEAWADAFGDDEGVSVLGQLVGDVAASDLPPEVRADLARQLSDDDAAIERLAERVAAYLD